VKGPRNKAAMHVSLPHGALTIRQFRKPPQSELVLRRGEAWALLAWYHHEVFLRHYGLRAWLRRVWWTLTRQKVKLLSPWEQLSLRDQIEDHAAAMAAAQAEQEAVAEALKADLDGHRN